MSSSLKSSNINSSNICSRSYVGVDVAKSKLDIFISDTGEFFTITNSKAGINKFIKSHLLNLNNPLVVCETTGGWERIMLLCLVKHNIDSHLAHASKIHYYAKSKGILAKTDKLDAKIIASFAISENLSPSDNSLDEVSVGLKDLVMRKIQIKETLCHEKQRRRDHLSKQAQKSIERSINFCNKELICLDKEINKIFDSKEEYVKANKIKEIVNE
jgi:transposase